MSVVKNLVCQLHGLQSQLRGKTQRNLMYVIRHSGIMVCQDKDQDATNHHTQGYSTSTNSEEREKDNLCLRNLWQDICDTAKYTETFKFHK